MNGFGQFTRYLWLVSSILLITSIFGYLYYLETEQKEDYFNQLYFRKLGEISSSFEINLVRLMNFSSQVNKNSSEILVGLKQLDEELAREKDMSSLDMDYQETFGLELLRSIEAPGSAEALHAKLVNRAYQSFEEFGRSLLDIKAISVSPCNGPSGAAMPAPDPARAYCDELGASIDLVRQLERWVSDNENTRELESLKGLSYKLEQTASAYATTSTQLYDQADAGYSRYALLKLLDLLRQLPSLRAEPEKTGLELSEERIRDDLPELLAAIEHPALGDQVRALFTHPYCALCRAETPLPNPDLVDREYQAHLAQVRQLLVSLIYAGVYSELASRLSAVSSDLNFYLEASADPADWDVSWAEDQQDYLRMLVEQRDYYLLEQGPIVAAAARHGLQPSFLPDKHCPIAGPPVAGEQSDPGALDRLGDVRTAAARYLACRHLLFIKRAERRTPYHGSSIAVTSYLGDDGALETPLENFLPSELEDFSSLLLAQGNGDVIIQVNKRSDETSHNFLSVRHLLEKISGGRKEENARATGALLSHTAFVDEDIGGIMHRVYIYPHKTSELDIRFGDSTANEKQLFFVGVKPLGDIIASKLSISPGTSALLLAAALIILLAFIFLKIQLAHVDASFTRLEAAIAGAAMVFLVLISLVGTISMGITDRMVSETRQQAQHTIEVLQARFKAELDAQLNRVDGLLRQDRALVMKLSTYADGAGGSSAYANSPCIHEVHIRGVYLANNLPAGREHTPTYFLENLFMLRGNGRLAGALARGTEHLASPTNPNLSGRRYFIKAMARDVWEVEVASAREPVEPCGPDPTPRQKAAMMGSGTSDRAPPVQRQQTMREIARTPGAYSRAAPRRVPLYMERIFNLADGVLNTQVAIPVTYAPKASSGSLQIEHATERYGLLGDEMPSAEGEGPEVISFGLTLRTLHAPILPAGLQFAVIENATGNVLYHSDDKRSLVENFFKETENNPNLRAQIRAGSRPPQRAEEQALEPERDSHIESFTGLYRGRDALFWTGRLHPDIPWTLVVLDDGKHRQSMVTILFTVAIMICTGIVLILSALLLLMNAFNARPLRWLWPQEGKFHLYPRLIIFALLLSIPYYWLLNWLPNAATFVVVTLVVSLVLLYVFGWWFATSEMRIENTPHRRRYLRYRYSVFVISLLVILVAVPASLVTRKVADELLMRTSLYEAMLYEESKASARLKVNALLERVCGKPDAQAQPFQECASLFGYALRPQSEVDWSESSPPWELDESWFEYIVQPTHTLQRQPCAGTRLFCSSRAAPANLPPRAGYSDALMQLLEPFWELPVVLDAVEAQAPGLWPRFAINDTDVYHLLHQTPSFWRFFPGNPALLLVLLLTTATVYAAVNFLSIKLLGIKVPRSYRSLHTRLDKVRWPDYIAGKSLQDTGAGDYARLHAALAQPGAHFGVLIRPDHAHLEFLLDALHDQQVGIETGRRTIDAVQLAEDAALRAELAEKLKGAGTGSRLVVLENFESVAFNAERRQVLLKTLEKLVNNGGGVSVVLVCDVAPLYMLTHQSRYIPNSMAAQYADAQESIRWSRLLGKFTKYYGWSPAELEFTDPDPWENVVLREVSAWPELYPMKAELDQLKAGGLSQEQAIQYVSTHAGPLYRRRWSLCTKEEKLLLYQLARGHLINPENIEPLEHLMRRGFVRRDPQWSIVNESFARFVMTAEQESVYVKWMRASEQGLWKVLRVPLFTAALVILGILVYSAQEAIESFLALATGILALLPILVRNFNMVRGSPPPAVSDS